MDQADSQQGSPPILFDQPSHVLQDDSSLLHWSNKRFSQITTEVLGQSDFANGQEGSRTLIDNALQTNGLFTPPQSNCIGHFSNHLLLQQSLNAGASADRRHTSNDQETFLTFFDDGLRTNELSTVSPPHQPSYLEDFLGHTLLEQSADAAAYSQGSYPVNNQHSSLADRGNALQHPPSSDFNPLGYFPNYTLKQSASATSYPQCSSPTNNQETFLAFVDVVHQTSGLAPAPPQPNHLEDILNYTLSGQSAHAAAYSQCSYPVNKPQTTLTNLNNTVQLSPAYSNHLGNFPIHKLLEHSAGVAASSQGSYPANDPQTTLTDLDNTIQPSPAYPNYFGNFPNHTLEQSAGVAAYSQCSYPANDLQTTLTDLDNTIQTSPSSHSNHLGDFPNHTLEKSVGVAAYPQGLYPSSDPQTTLTDLDNIIQPSPSSHSNHLGNFPNHTLLAEFTDATTYSQILYPANNPQTTLADLGNAHQNSPPSQSSCHGALENNTLAENVGQSFIIIPLSLALTEHQDPAQNFQQYPLPWLLQSNIEHQPGSPSAGMALVKQSLALNRRQNPCIGCRLRKIKCEKAFSSTGESRCVRCVRQHIPQQVCIRLRVTDYKVFEKWQNEIYETQFTLVRSSNSSSRRTAELEHYPDGPPLLVDCCEFRPTEHYQTEVVRKNSSGSHVAKTTAFCLINPRIDISPYVQKCIRYAISEACKRQDIVSTFFRLACSYRHEPIIQRCFEMYTALRLMMKGCQFSGKRKKRTGIDDDYLGMAKIEDGDSAWFGCIPVPRMVTNQVNHRLELRMKELDSDILKDADELLQTKKQHAWVVGTLAVFLVLHIRELDAGRNIFWKRYKDPLGFWIHPSKPQALIEEAIAFSNSLLSHYHYVFGRKPLDMNWDEQRSRDMVNDDKTFIDSVKTLQTYVSELMEKGMVGRKACDIYEAGNPKSVDFTTSSLLFVKNISEGCEVKGFY